jgi:hypothetical protein
VAATAVCPELACVRIAILVAGIAVSRSTLVDIVDMAIRTCRCAVSSGQFERGQVVVEGGWQPCACAVAATAAGSKSSSVGVAILVAGIAVIGRALVNIIDMATQASGCTMFAG